MGILNRRIEITLSKTINLGNYESSKVQVGLTTDVPDDANLQEAYDMIESMVLAQLNKTIEKTAES